MIQKGTIAGKSEILGLFPLADWSIPRRAAVFVLVNSNVGTM